MQHQARTRLDTIHDRDPVRFAGAHLVACLGTLRAALPAGEQPAEVASSDTLQLSSSGAPGTEREPAPLFSMYFVPFDTSARSGR